MKAFWLSAALIVALPIAEIRAATPLSEADVRDAECLSVFAHTLGTTLESDAQKWAGLVSVVAYYTGKLSGRHPDLDLGTILTPELIEKVMSNWAPTAERCNKESAAMSQHMITVGNKLQALGEKIQETGS